MPGRFVRIPFESDFEKVGLQPANIHYRRGVTSAGALHTPYIPGMYP